MKHISIEKHIEVIVENSNDTLFYLSTRTGHLPNNQKFPVVIAYAQSGSLIDYKSIDTKTGRVINVSLSMLEKELQPEFVSDGRGGQTRESEDSYLKRVVKRREEMVLVFEQIIHYLTDEQYTFKYEIVSNIDYSPIDVEENAYGLYGMQCVFSALTGFVTEHCCIDFDETAIKAYNKKSC